MISPRFRQLARPYRRTYAVGFVMLHPIGTAAAIAAGWSLSHIFAWWVSRLLGGVNAATLDAVAETAELSCLGAIAGAAYLLSLSVV